MESTDLQPDDSDATAVMNDFVKMKVVHQHIRWNKREIIIQKMSPNFSLVLRWRKGHDLLHETSSLATRRKFLLLI